MLLTPSHLLRRVLISSLCLSTIAFGCATTKESTTPDNKPREGDLTKDEVEGVIRDNLKQIKSCYEKNLRDNRNLQGRVVTSFEIGTDGRVTKSEIDSSTLGNLPTEECIALAVKQWQFPVPRGGGVVKVRYPFVLQPR